LPSSWSSPATRRSRIDRPPSRYASARASSDPTLISTYSRVSSPRRLTWGLAHALSLRIRSRCCILAPDAFCPTLSARRVLLDVFDRMGRRSPSQRDDEGLPMRTRQCDDTFSGEIDDKNYGVTSRAFLCSSLGAPGRVGVTTCAAVGAGAH
jgi:hypothetical protein